MESEAVYKSYTKDGKHIKIMSNIDVVDVPDKINKYNLEGIGLARSEFMFHDRENIPKYEEQFVIYKELLLNNKEKEVVIRTFDFSEEETPNTLKVIKQENPALGLRGIRFSFHRDIFKNQLKALIKSSEYGRLKILIPMFTIYEEFKKIKDIEKEILDDLGISKNYKLGIMLETISSLYVLEDIYQEIDFISLGTNDLMQYFFAVDRNNNYLNHIASPFNPAFIRFLKDLTSKVRNLGLELSVCGKIASTPKMIPVLIGLDLDILSVSPFFIPLIKRVIKKISYQDTKILLNELINIKTAEETEKKIHEFLLKNGLDFVN